MSLRRALPALAALPFGAGTPRAKRLGGEPERVSRSRRCSA
jgi:hypothetical protein